jgi:hypothetical protein
VSGCFEGTSTKIVSERNQNEQVAFSFNSYNLVTLMLVDE